MTSPLYGRKLEPKLVRDLLIRPESIVDGRPDRSPIVVLEGGAATGKTALLSEMANGWAGTVPCSYLDIEAIESELGEVAIAELLAAIAFQLARHCKIYGSLRFNRLVIGLQAMRLELSDVDPQLARSQVLAMLNGRRQLANVKQVLGDVAQVALVLAPVQVAVSPSFVQRMSSFIVDSLAPRLLSRDALGRAQSWYGHQDRELELDPIGQLIDLNWARHHPAQADARSQAGDLLCDAFLADLRDNFRTGRHSDEWPLHCLVLLDNVDCDLGQSFLRQIVAVQRLPDNLGVALPDPVVVVGSSRGGLIAAMTQAERTTVREVADRPEPDGPPPRWLRRTLSPLTVEDVRTMASTLPAAYCHRNLAAMLHQLSGGHPGGVAFLLRAIMEHRPGIVEPENLLGLPHRDSTIEGALLKRLLIGVREDDVDALITCSAARNRREGLRLLGRATDHNVSSALLPVGMWDPETGAHTTLLRLLLLRRLARRPDDHPWNWARAHDALRTVATPDGAQADVTSWLQHTLAMGQIEAVLRVLTGHLRTYSLPDWLSLLRAVAQAPFHLEQPGRPGDPETEFPPFLRPLLTRLQKSSDPLCDSDRSILYARIANGFNDLSKHIDDTCDELLDLITHYEQMAQQWRRGALWIPLVE